MDAYADEVARLFTDQGFAVSQQEPGRGEEGDDSRVAVLRAEKDSDELRIICAAFDNDVSAVKDAVEEVMQKEDVRTLLFVPETDDEEQVSELEQFADEHGIDLSLFSPHRQEDTPDLPDNMPSSYEVIGSIGILNIDSDVDNIEEIAAAIMRQNPQVSTVLRKQEQLSGEFRVGGYEIIAGEETETVHREHGCRYRVNPTQVYFSERLSHERERVTEKVQEGEMIQVWFAGVGPYAIMFARKRSPAKVYGIEKNPAGCRYMEENIALNKVEDVVEARCGDVREIAPELPKADRIVMPLPKASNEFLPLAFDCVREGGIIHYYRFSRDEEQWEQPLEEVEEAAEETGRSYEIVDRAVCGHYAPYIHRVCLDIRVD